MKRKWRDVVNHALGQWQVATDGLVTMEFQRHWDPRADGGRGGWVSKPCTDYSTYIPQLVAHINLHYPEMTDIHYQLAMDYLKTLPAYTIIRQLDKEWSEIKALDLDDYLRLSQRVFNFPALSSDIGVSRCLVIFPTAGGCTDRYPDPDANDFAASVDITINARHEEISLSSPPSLPGADGVPDVKFNTCPTSGHRAYQSLVHEAGHALGIGGSFGMHPFDNASPYSAMSTLHPRRCSPHPLDIMAIYALYQSRMVP